MGLYALVILSALFAITHIVPSHGGIRAGLIEKHGEMKFRAVYSALSLITLGGAIALFVFHKGEGPVYWETPRLAYIVGYPLNFLALFLLAGIPFSPSPLSMMPGKNEVRGVLKITRHPMNMGIAFWALAHMVSNGNLAGLAFFGALFVTGFAGAYHMDGRKVRELDGAADEFRDRTSVLPFAAILDGRQWIEREDLRPAHLLAAILGFLLVLFFHGALFGATPW